MVKFLHYGLSRQLLGYTLQIGDKKKIKILSNQLRTIASNKNFVSMSALQIKQIYKFFIVLNKQYLKQNQWKQYNKLKPAKYTSYLNAKLQDTSTQTQKNWQQCASYPGLKMLIQRPKSIKLTYMDQNLKDYLKIQFTGFQSRVIQHQLDHTYGYDYIKIAHQLQIANEQCKQKYQQQCNQLFYKFKSSVKQQKINYHLQPNLQFYQLKQFLTFSIVDKCKLN